MNSSNPTNSSPSQTPIRKYTWLGILVYLLILGLIIIFAGLAGYQSADYTYNAIETAIIEQSLEEQYQLALQDMQAQRYEVALQRFEYIIAQDPSYPGITDQMANAMQILYSTATPTPPDATITPTPTRDLRPVEDLFTHALTLTTDQAWTEAIDTLIALRKEDRDFMTARVDGLLYLSLRQRGVEKIWELGNLEGGSYDLSLAERFGPLDVQANSARDLARLYIIGSSFWEIHPEQAIFYFSQVASAAPGLRDASGWTALERYRASLIQYGDLLVSEKAWCEAQIQYELAMSIRPDDQLAEILKAVILKCSPPTSTLEPETPSVTPSMTQVGPTLPPQFTATPSPTIDIQPTQTSITPSSTGVPATPTETIPPQPPTATETQIIPPSPSATQEVQPTATQTPEASLPDLNSEETKPLNIGKFFIEFLQSLSRLMKIELI